MTKTFRADFRANQTLKAIHGVAALNRITKK